GRNKDNYMYVTYRDNRSNDVKVTIVENKVKAIRFERDDVILFENADMHYDEWDQRYYYDIPQHHSGDKLIVIDNDNAETVYEYEERESDGAYVSEGHDDIPADEVHFNSDQRDNPWHVGDNQYTVEYSGREFPLTATVQENPVAGIEYVKSQTAEMFANTNGGNDSETGNYHYNYAWCEGGDKLIVIDKENNRTVYECKLIDEENWEYAFVSDDNAIIPLNKVSFNDNQHDEPWHVGNDNPYYVSYMGAAYTLYATVKENLVKSIRFEPKNTPVLMVGVRSYYDEDLGYYVYDAPDFCVGDKLIVIDKNNDEKIYTAQYDDHYDLVFASDDGDVIDRFDIMTDTSSQWETPWTIGDSNEYGIYYMGATSYVKCTILDNPVESISFIQSPVPSYLAGTNMYHDEFAGRDFYERPRINESDVLVVVYADERGRVEYTAKDDPERGGLIFESQDGEVLVEDYRFEYFDNQWETPWTVGTNYWTFSFCGKAAKVPVIIENNTITGISYKSVATPKVWAADYEMDTDPETGIEYKHYNIPELQDGDILTVYYSDKPAEDYVLTFDENDGERCFVNGDTRFDCHILVPFDKQNETEWQLGDGNYYYIDLYGNAAPIEVEVIDNDVQSVTFNTQAPIVIDEYTGGSFEYNHLGKIYVYDYQSIIPLGASVTVKYINGDEVEYFFSVDEENRPHLVANDLSELDINELNTVDNQWDEPWKVGLNYFAISYHGVRTEDITVTVNHTPGEVVVENNIPATCETAGSYDEVVYCTACGIELSRTPVTGNALGHDYIEKVDAKYLKTAADCTHKAVYYKSCSRCGLVNLEETFESGSPLGHNYTNTVDAKYLKTAADCTHAAVYYKSCSRCEIASTTETFESGSPLGHITVEAVKPEYLKSAADCTHAAVYYKSCSRCNSALTETFESGSPLGHITVEAVKPEYLKSAADCTNAAVYYKSCSRCNSALTEIFESGSPLGHTPATAVSENVVPATCEAAGSHDSVVYCSVCGGELSRTPATDNALGHNESDWVIVKRPTFEETGLKQKICTACGEVIESEVIPAVKSTDPRIEVESVTGVAGTTVDVKVMFKNNPGIASAKLNISFPDELTLMNVTYGNLGENVMPPETFESPVTLNWYSNLVNLTTSDFTFATLTFAVAENAALGEYRITVDYDYDDIFNIYETNIDFAVINGIVTINDHLPGDINGDGKVNNKDIVRLFKYLSDWDVEVDSKALDVNGDGAVNNKDLLRLFKYLSNWDVKIY
ncbi:MAG: hypothetical protein IKN39_03380, partial [Clostridia bacterium]|nr:hypothetical protein [Clostridia bacterium]